MNSQSFITESSKSTLNADLGANTPQTQQNSDSKNINNLLLNTPTALPTQVQGNNPVNATLVAQATDANPRENYVPGLRELDTPRRPSPAVDPGPLGGDHSAFDKGLSAWVKDYVSERFPASMQDRATSLVTNVLRYYGDKPEQPFVRAELKDILSSDRRSPEDALLVLETLRLEMRGAKPQPLNYSGETPLKTLEAAALQSMGRKSFNDVTDLIVSVKGMSTTNTETREQTKDRVKAEQHIRNFAQSLGQTDITNISVKPRDPNNIIALTHQESSATFMKSPHAFASDISWDSKGPVGVPMRSKITAWFNPSVFARVGTPYADSKGGAINPTTGKNATPTLQSVVRLGAFEAGIQGNAGLNDIENRSRYLNTGFSVAVRGPSFKAVIDFNPNAPNNLPDPKKKLTASPSFNMSVDMSGYVTLGPFRGGPYFELGRFAKGKDTKVFDKFNIGPNPEFLKDLMDGKFVSEPSNLTPKKVPEPDFLNSPDGMRYYKENFIRHLDYNGTQGVFLYSPDQQRYPGSSDVIAIAGYGQKTEYFEVPKVFGGDVARIDEWVKNAYEKRLFSQPEQIPDPTTHGPKNGTYNEAQGLSSPVTVAVNLNRPQIYDTVHKERFTLAFNEQGFVVVQNGDVPIATLKTASPDDAKKLLDMGVLRFEGQKLTPESIAMAPPAQTVEDARPALPPPARVPSPAM